MLQGHRIGGLLLMGGVGKRFGSNMPKQFHHLSGKPIYRVTLEAFLASNIFDEIVLSCHVEWIETVKQELALMNVPIAVRIANGGVTRQESSYQGLKKFLESPQVVLIHDAVRPFVSKEMLRNTALLAIEHGAVDTCIGSTDTIVHSLDGEKIDAIPERSHYFRGQTPQGFSFPLILAAHEKTKRYDASDDCRLVLESGHKVYIAPGEEHNLKISSELDLFVAEQLFRLKMTKCVSKPQISLIGKRYAVVGGTGGIGASICQLIEKAGAVALSLARQTAIPLDLRVPKSIESAFAKIGPIDGLINSAGLFLTGSLPMMSQDAIEAILDVNLKGLILCCKEAQLKPGAHIINVASSSFSRGRKGASIYSCSKAAVVNFTQALAEERPDLFVHAVIPQRTRTAMRQKNFPLEDPKTLLDPTEVAEIVLELLADVSSTGGLVEVRKNYIRCS